MMRYFRCISSCLIFCLPLLVVAAESPKDVAHNLKGKTVFLRGMYIENDLAFDSQGNATGTATRGPFSVSAIKIEKATLDGATIELTGHRGGLIFLGPATPSHPEQFDFVRFSPETHIRIATDPKNPESFQSLVSKIFAANIEEALAEDNPEERQAALESLAEVAPPSVKSAAVISGLPGGTQRDSPNNGVRRVGGGVTAPRVVYSVPPSPPAGVSRASVRSGICVLNLIIDKTGFPTRIRVAKSLTPEQDKAAVVAVSQYRFAPAIYENHPVAVEVNIEVNFVIG